MQEPRDYDTMPAKIIHSSDEMTTLIAWLKEGAPSEEPIDEIEKFLIIEGICEITIGDTIQSLQAGDYLEIPLYVSHSAIVTSEYRCKIIVERSAA